MFSIKQSRDELARAGLPIEEYSNQVLPQMIINARKSIFKLKHFLETAPSPDDYTIEALSDPVWQSLKVKDISAIHKLSSV